MGNTVILTPFSSEYGVLLEVLRNNPVSEVVIVDNKTVDHEIHSAEDFRQVYNALVEEVKSLLERFIEERDPIVLTVNYFVAFDIYRLSDPIEQNTAYFHKLFFVKNAVERLTKDPVTFCYEVNYELLGLDEGVKRSLGMRDNKVTIRQCKTINYRDNLVSIISKLNKIARQEKRLP